MSMAAFSVRFKTSPASPSIWVMYPAKPDSAKFFFAIAILYFDISTVDTFPAVAQTASANQSIE